MTVQVYLPRLDGLRAISIVLVLVEHFFWNSHGAGDVGVTIFFVISGYLITSILVSYSEVMTIRNAAARFYWRRSIRLFPIYYLCIVVTAIFAIGGMRYTWWINALYLMNFKVAWNGAWNGSSHFWSLCVEEQFYLLWFVVVMAIPRRFLLAAIVFFIALAPLYRGAAYLAGASPFENVLLPGAMDSLATGALIFYAVRFSPESLPWKGFQKARWPLAYLSGCMLIGIHILGDDLLTRVFFRIAMNIFSACLISLSIEKAEHWSVDWLGGAAIRHIGKISYGIYVYHYFVPEIVDAHIRFDWVHSYTGGHLLRFIVLSAMSVAIAEISWRVIERPISKFKDRMPFSYRSRGKAFQ